MGDSDSTKKQSRGIIIVDTSCLINMCKKPKITPGKESFLDSLGYLAQHGFTIVIPEFVVIEATNKCPTRELEALLKRAGAVTNHVENRDKFLNFLEKNKDRIIIEKANPQDRDGNSLPYFGICQLVREAVEMAQPGYADTHKMPENHHVTPQDYWDRRAKSNIRAAMNAARQHADLGEIHCFRVILDSMIHGYLNSPHTPKTPMYFLCDDTTSKRKMYDEFIMPSRILIKDMENPPTLNFLTVAGFFRALDDKGRNGQETSLLKKMGILENSEAVLRIMYEDDEWYNHVRNHAQRDRTVLTSNPSPHPYPFGKAISDLRHDLERDAKTGDRGSMVNRISGAGQSTGANHLER
ncbi:MAG: hypothetical protein KGI29_04490 [Pseudomonadota bacterium]|nr:hypothetical protein [Pseudomonadota bacterium]MDE3037306.1 hypothetical protein [Pseudomonadota bacterium]